MKRAIIARSLLIALAALFIAGAVSVFILQRQYINSVKNEMGEIISIISATENKPDYAALAKRLSEIRPDKLRVTFIAPDGNVLGDSEANHSSMENHKNRPEFKAAIKNGYGENIRRSATLGIDMLYVAEKLPDGNIVRLAANLKSLHEHIWTLLPGILTGIILALLITPLLAWRISSGFTKPFSAVADSLKSINAGGYGAYIKEPKYSELSHITEEINTLSGKISNTLRELTAERKRINYLLNNMSEGFVVLDGYQHILIINRSASEFFGSKKDASGENLLFLTRNAGINEAVRNASCEGRASAFDIDSPAGENKVSRISISPVAGGEFTKGDGGVIMLVTDVTSARKAERIRSEFVANASHELKTPLTSIKGFAELLDAGIIGDAESRTRYLKLIKAETDRMIVLINDILRLSELESISDDYSKSPVSLRLIANKVMESLTIQAEDKNVAMTVSGASGEINANPDRMTQLVLNLMDNAIKYNRPGGKADITISESADAVELKVADTGIGIPEEDQQRVFERFYRVDKGRSRKMGGTGLGLSIVKHIAGLYGGKISLESKAGAGAEIVVTLPKQ